MMLRRWCRKWLTNWALFAVSLGACQPLPHPFDHDRPPAALMSVPDSADIAVGTIEGEPKATASKLGPALASALLKHEIPATHRTTSISSYRLEARIQQGTAHQGKAVVTVFWRLRDPRGRVVAERDNQLEAAVRDWENGDDDRIAQLAEPAAAELAALLADEAPKQQQDAAPSGRTRVAVRKIAGAPGDGNESLASAVTAVLKRSDIDVVDKPDAKHDVDVDGDITVDPAKGDRQHIKIVWRVARATGGQIGTVAQENDVPRGQLDGAWGDVAYSVAVAAQSGLMELVNRGAPPIRVTGTPSSAAEATAAQYPVPPAAGAPPGAGTSPTPPGAVTTSPPPVFDAAPTIPYRGVAVPH
jgi:hypothetical protein